MVNTGTNANSVLVQSQRTFEKMLPKITGGVLDLSLEGQWYWDVENELVWINPRFQELLQMTQQSGNAFVPITWSELLEEDPPRLASGKEDLFEWSLILKSAQGRRLPTLWRGRSELTEDGKQCIYGICVDMSAEKEVNDEVDRITYALSHDLNSAIRHIKSYLSLLFDKQAFDKSHEEHQWIGYINDAVARIHHLVSGTTQLSFIRRDKFNPDIIDLNDVLEDCLLDLASEISQSGAKISYNRMPTAYADPKMLKQLLSRLIENAIQYAKPQQTPHITVNAESTNGLCTISVQDNGQGIPDEIAEQIFLAFFRYSPAGPSTRPGLGLTQCKKIAAIHNGQISSTKLPQGGTQFTVTLHAKGP